MYLDKKLLSCEVALPPQTRAIVFVPVSPKTYETTDTQVKGDTPSNSPARKQTVGKNVSGFQGWKPLTVATLCDTVFLSFGSVFFIFAFKKKENEHRF